jgi:hypothetical protein
MATLFKGTAGTDEQVKGWKAGMSKAQTPAQIKTGIDEALDLMNGRYDALDHQFSTGMGRVRNFKMLSPASEAILTGLGAKEFVQKDTANAPQAQQPAAAGPPQAVVDAAPEGSYMHSPDGKVSYRKINGKAVQQ